MSAPLKICIMTGSRAEYGLLYWLMRDLAADADVDFSLVVSAMHLAPEFGETINLIRADGFEIYAEVPCLVSGDDNVAMGKSTARALDGFVDAFSRASPDIVVLLGDRFEVMAAAIAAAVLRIPIAHLHGGELSQGAIDDAFRHAVTKLAHLHFVAADDYARRVIQLGEDPGRVFNVGALGLENFVRLQLPDKQNLAERMGFDLAGDYLVVAFHPATLESKPPVDQIEELLKALDRFPDLKVVISKANADPGGRAINQRLDAYARARPQRIHLAASLGQANYLAALQNAAAVVGNSSSGIIEAPAVGVPTVNVGTRQAGRLLAASVFDCDDDADAIVVALQRALSAEWREFGEPRAPPYGLPGPVASRVIRVLKETDLESLRSKVFYDHPGR